MPGKDELVSVIIPCYNGEKYLAETIESALSQTHRNLEVVIVDDASTDNTAEVAEGFAADPRVVFVRHQENKGIPGTRNDGVAASRGEYLAFLDQDDLLFPSRIEDQLEVFRQNPGRDIGLVFSNIRCLENGEFTDTASPRNKVPGDFNRLPAGKALERLFVVNYISILTALIPRQCLEEAGGFDEEILSGADDYDLFLRIASKRSIYYLDRTLGTHRLHGRNYYSLLGSIEDEYRIARKMLALEPSLAAVEKKKYGCLDDAMGTYHFINQDFGRAAKHFRKAVKNDPVNPGYIFKYLLAESARVLPAGLSGRIYSVGKRLGRLPGGPDPR